MNFFALIGKPLKHSLSPLLHSVSFSLMRYKGYYFKKEFNENQLNQFMEQAKMFLLGFNVTMPYKEKVLGLLDKVNKKAEEIGSVNTILVKKGKLIGYNTDFIGVRKSLEFFTALEDKKIAIIGAGGAAKSAVFALLNLSKVTIFNRNYGKALNLAKNFGVEAEPLSNYKKLKDFDIIINATPVGMDGKSIPFPPEVIKKEHFIMDMIYKPLYTPLLKEALKRGASVVNGLPMLIIQGLESEKIWIGKAPKWNIVYSKLITKLNKFN